MGHISYRNCLLQQVIEGKVKGGIEKTGRRGKRRRKLLDDIKEMIGYSLLKSKLWIALFGEFPLEEVWPCRTID